MQLAQNPLFQQIRENYENQTPGTEIDDNPITIPVVVHVLWHIPEENISDAQIQSQIDVLNQDFRLLNADAAEVPPAFSNLNADCKFNFVLAKTDPDGCATTGIVRRETFREEFGGATDESMKFYSQGGLDIWNRDHYLNIWVCNLDNTTPGFAQFPGLEPETDGIVVDYSNFGTIGVNPPYNLGRTTVHEVGHWLDCHHIWGGSDSADCFDTDLVGDTPNQEGPSGGCPDFPQISCSNGPNGDLFYNYMDYTNDYCRVMFTSGQKTRMRSLFGSGGLRQSLINSPGGDLSCYCSTGLVTHINSNTIYGTDINIPGDVYIHSGAELIVSAKMGMLEGFRVIVERNARLVIEENGVISKSCNAPNWEGIQVLGNSQKIQPEFNAALTDPEQAGIVWIKKGSIEFANKGIYAGGQPGQGGGLVRADDAKFVQNKIDVDFQPYKFSLNKSRFFNSIFTEVDNQWFVKILSS